jgi:peptide/nickel transport system permease protein
MTAYLIRRTVSTLILLFLIISVVFMLIHLLPGDPAMTILGGMDAEPTEADIQRVRERLGLDRPIHVQYVEWLGGLARFDLGDSYVTGRSISGDMAVRLPRTLSLIVPAIVLAVLIGVPLGILAASLRRSTWDPIISATALLGFSTPVFVSGLLLVLVFALQFQMVPSGGYVSPGEDLTGFLRRAILPTVTLALGPMAITMRMTRSSVLEQLGLDYVRTARSKGVDELRVIYRHVLRNALLPVVTIVGLQFGAMFAGSVLVEFIFNWPGVNSYLLQAIGVRDYPIVQAVVLVVAVIFVTINFVTDIFFAILDPRIRYD